jgi:glycosyltransferase involved in cell wall biosynthesis
VIDGSTGILVPVREPDALAEALSALISDPTLRHTMGNRGKARMEQEFDIATMTARYETLYTDLLRERSANPTRPLWRKISAGFSERLP